MTFRLAKGALTGPERDLVLRHIRTGSPRFYDLLAAVVLREHVHLVLRLSTGIGIGRVMKGIKGVSARLLNLRRGGRGKVWQADYFDRIIRGERELYNTLNYMLSNPVKHGLAEDPMEYPGWYLAPDAGGEAT